MKTYIVTPHLNCLDETVQMRGHNMSFYAELTKIIIKYSLLSRALFIFFFCLHFQGKSTLKGKNLYLLNKLLAFRTSGKQTRSHKSKSCVKWQKNMAVFQFILNASMSLFSLFLKSESCFENTSLLFSHLVCVCVPILVTTFPEWLSGTEPLPHTPGAVRPSSLCL